MKGRSELETETIIRHFLETLLSCIVCSLGEDTHLNPLHFIPSVLHLRTYTHALSQAPFSGKKNCFPLSILQQETLKSDAQWATVAFMGQDAHSNAS